MLDSLHIQNYRLFKDLKIDNLRRVNLIAGKNNTGKTALLEALRIYESDMDLTVINNIIFKRGDWKKLTDNDYENDKILFENYLTLFNDKKNIHGNSFKINEQNLRIQNFQGKYGAFLGYYVNENRSIHSNNYIDSYNANDVAVYVALSENLEINYKLWKSIDTHPEEDDVLSVLQTIDSRIKKIGLNGLGFVVLLNNLKYPISLKNLGDGANRLLTIALALVSAKDKTLLIDEFEVGLHHSVQQQLWEIIFEYAEKWNIQVFATTHSQDTVEKFYYVANMPQNMGKGKYFTLNRDGEDIVAVDYDMEEIKLALESNIEIR